MGLATSQVRLLALTSRKADVEMKIQLNSKHKTMLTRESSELAKLYYAKLQNSRIQYATSDGYQDVTYDYLMGQDSFSYYNDILTKGTYLKPAGNMLLTDNYGRVILSDDMLDIVLETLNNNKNEEDVDDLTYYAIGKLLYKIYDMAPNEAEIKEDIGTVKAWYSYLINPDNKDILEYFANNGVYSTSMETVRLIDNKVCERNASDSSNPITPVKGRFYYFVNSESYTRTHDTHQLYFPTNKNADEFGFVRDPKITIDGQTGHLFTSSNDRIAKLRELCNLFNYYGYMFSAAFNGNQTVNYANMPENNTRIINNFNVAIASGDVVYDPSTQKYVRNSNSKYKAVTNTDNLQEGLQSGIYQLVEVASKTNGTYTKAHGLDYFETLNYVTEKSDSDSRESVTAWYNAAKADLSEKEDYWDAEITALSSELNAITTEIESVKSLRQNAIESTFKWGSA